MAFEQRVLAVSGLSAEFGAAGVAFFAGRTREACVLLASKPVPLGAEDWLLLMALARASGRYRRSMALARLAFLRCPQDGRLALMVFRGLLNRGRGWAALQFLQDKQALGLAPSLGWDATQLGAFGGLLEADALAVDGAFDAAREALGEAMTALLPWRERAGDGATLDAFLADCFYQQAAVLHALRDWPAAIEAVGAAVALAPSWMRLRVFLVDALLSAGRLDDAQLALDEASALGLEEMGLESTAALWAFSFGRFELAQARLEQCLSRWDAADSVSGLKRVLAMVLLQLGELDALKQRFAGQEEDLGFGAWPECLDSRHALIDLPLFVQQRNECVPTSVAMITALFGQSFEPGRLFEQMDGREGVALWRMRRWLKEHGFVAVSCRLEVEGLRSLLDAGVPMIGTTEGLFHSHVEVVCGYRQDLDVLYVRDPMDWVPVVVSSESLASRYAMQGGVIAVVPEERRDLVDLVGSLRAPDSDALLDLAAACDGGDLAAAEAAFAVIADDSPLAFVRNELARMVVLTPSAYGDQLERLARDAQGEAVVRYRALLGLSPELAAQLVADDDSGVFSDLSVFARRYLRLFRLLAAARWDEALALVDWMISQGPGVADIWSIRSDVCAELGDQQGSDAAMERVLALEPARPQWHQKRLNRQLNVLVYADFLRDFEALEAANPENKGLLWGKADLLSDGPDGLAFEAAIRAYLGFFPRDPNAWERLMDWLRYQQRGDLAGPCLQQVRALMPEEFALASDEDAGAASAEALPEEVEALLSVAWTMQGERAAAAMARLLEALEAERLGWSARARLLALRLLAVDLNAPERLSLWSRLLEEPLAGYAVWYVSAVVDALTRRDLDGDLASLVRVWLEQKVPNFEAFADLALDRVVLFEAAGLNESALEALESMVSRYPAHASARYRLGVVKREQHDFSSAVAHFEAALAVNPGLPGAMEHLRQIGSVLDDSAMMESALSGLCLKFPYEPDYWWDALRLRLAAGDESGARERLEQGRALFEGAWWFLAAARLALALEDWGEAKSMLNEVPVPEDEDLFKEWINVALQLAQRLEDGPWVRQLVEIGLGRWPDSASLVAFKARLLAQAREGGASDGLEFLAAGFARGVWDEEMLGLWLDFSAALRRSTPLQAAGELLDTVPVDDQVAVAGLLAERFQDPERMTGYGLFLEEAHRRFPQHDQIAFRLASHYDLLRQPHKAIDVAQSLVDRSPDKPEWLLLLGRVWVDKDASKGLALIERSCELDRSADALSEKGRALQILGKKKAALVAHREALELNPLNVHSWVNLYLGGEDEAFLWGYVESLVVAGFGVEDEYFLAAVLRIARRLRKTVPPAWGVLANDRLRVLGARPGFSDEKPLLETGLLVWYRLRPEDKPGPDELPSPVLSGFPVVIWVATRLALWFSPRAAWVPVAVETQS